MSSAMFDSVNFIGFFKGWLFGEGVKNNNRDDSFWIKQNFKLFKKFYINFWYYNFLTNVPKRSTSREGGELNFVKQFVKLHYNFNYNFNLRWLYSQLMQPPTHPIKYRIDQSIMFISNFSYNFKWGIDNVPNFAVFSGLPLVVLCYLKGC